MELISIDSIKEKLKQNKELRTNIELLVNVCISDKSLVFDYLENMIDVKLLESSDIIKHSSSKYSLEESFLFAYKFYKEYSNRESFSLGKDFSKTIEFLDKIKIDFKGVSEYYKIERQILSIVLLESNTKFKLNFLAYLSSYDKEKDTFNLHSFNISFGKLIPYLNISFSDLYSVLEYLIKYSDNSDLTKSAADGIREKVYGEHEFGINLFNYAINKEEYIPNILAPIISGLFDKTGETFFKQNLDHLVSDEEFSFAMIWGLSSSQTIDDKKANLLLSLIKRFNHNNEDVLIKIPILISSIIRSNLIPEDSVIKQKCFEEYIALIDYENANLSNNILSQIDYISSFEKERCQIIVELIQKENFAPDKHLSLIDNVVWHLKSFTKFKEILFSIAGKGDFITVSKRLSHSIYHYKKNALEEFEELIIEFLIHDKPSFRHIGHDLFLNFSNPISDNHFKFSFDILKLDKLSQYKLWVSICQDYREPKHIIPCLLPLLKSKSFLVREMFVFKLKELSISFGKALIEVLTEELNLKNIQENAILKDIKANQKLYFKQQIDPKTNVFELNPLYSQYRIFNDYMKKHQRDFSRNLSRGMKENSGFLSNIFSNVTLAKGGGWYNTEKNTIIPLGEFSSSFSLPRDYFLEPEFFDYDAGIEKSISWENKFKKVKENLDTEIDDK